MKRLCSTLLLGSLLGAPALAQTWERTSNLLAVGLPALAGAYTLQQQDWQGTAQAAGTLGGAAVSALVLKSHVDAPRPDRSDNEGFPSGHTTIAFASARFLHKRYGDAVHPVALYGAAALTAIGRVQSDRHYWRDTVAGAALGWVWAEALTEARPGTQLSLLPTPGGLALRWQQAW